ncbi:MAG: AsmA-like C-terminal domain-containing protein, partial [Planctomycetales bacterium]|nr:AsmA-like C-terminal domain-containing protein [Planctomycetales bacterium]
GRDTLRGDGHVWLRDADIYELPIMVSLLKIISIRRPDKTAFTSSDVDFRIAGEDVYLDRIVFSGDAVSLRGAGEVNLDRRVHLKLYTLVGNESRRIPLVWPLLADASRRILMLEVTGTLDDPLTNRHVLPGLNDTLRQLFPEELGAASPSASGGANRASPISFGGPRSTTP